MPAGVGCARPRLAGFKNGDYPLQHMSACFFFGGCVGHFCFSCSSISFFLLCSSLFFFSLAAHSLAVQTNKHQSRADCFCLLEALFTATLLFGQRVITFFCFCICTHAHDHFINPRRHVHTDFYLDGTRGTRALTRTCLNETHRASRRCDFAQRGSSGPNESRCSSVARRHWRGRDVVVVLNHVLAQRTRHKLIA
jgi:hypothetical protein